MKHPHGATIRAFSNMIERDRLADIWFEDSHVGHPLLTESDLTEQQAKVREVYLPQAENWIAEIHDKSPSVIDLIDNFMSRLFAARQPTAMA